MKREKIIEQLKWLYDAIETPEDAECLPELRHDTANKALQQAIDILEATNDRTAIIKEIIKNIEEYCVLDALPDKDSDFEKGMHYAGNGLVKLLKDKLSHADQP